jgi:TatD DNase family protein
LSVGVHPNVTEGHEPTVDELMALADNQKVIAIGETGLDYFHSSGDLEWQKQRFRNHISVAKTLNKPLIIHTREAGHDSLDILAEQGADQVGGIIHCFTEDWAYAEKALDLNFYISFSGIVTFKNAAAIQEVAKKVPADRFLIETDSPYLAPIPFRGKPNYPLYVRHVAEKLAELRNTSLEQIAQQSTDNFYRLFAMQN